jgi:hypothetical protein
MNLLRFPMNLSFSVCAGSPTWTARLPGARGHRGPLLFLLVLMGVAAGPFDVTAQHDHGAEVSVAMEVEPEMPLLTAVLGPYSRPVTTTAPAAQAFFDQGLQMVYAFTYPTAIRSFQEAHRQDPSCAMCFWGEALARGPFINSGMNVTNAGPAYEAAMEAVRLAGEVDLDPVERRLIEAMSVRYAEEHDPDTRASLDSAYSQAMEQVFRAHPDDLDVGTLYAESLMLLNTRRADYRIGDPFVQSFHEVLEHVLAMDLTHPGACHLYIHATEATEAPEKAEECADLLGDQIPGASHINHMPSHTYNRLGRWDSAVRSNIQAWHSDQRAAWGEGVSYAAAHNLHMLFFAASMDGQGAVAVDAARAYANSVSGGSFYEALVLLRFGRFDDILALDEPPQQPIQRGLWEFSMGYAHLRDGDIDRARDYLASVDEAAEETPSNVSMRGHSAANLLGIVGEILRAEILLEEGRSEEAIAALEHAVELQDGLHYDEPEPLNFSARHWLGAVLLEVGRPEEAEWVYQASLVQHPNNGWSYFGLEQALRAQGKDAEAAEANERFRDRWSRSDTLLRSSRF